MTDGSNALDKAKVMDKLSTRLRDLQKSYDNIIFLRGLNKFGFAQSILGDIIDSIEAGEFDLPPTVDLSTVDTADSEAESLATYNDLILRGYSDAEARGTAWPEEPSTADLVEALKGRQGVGYYEPYHSEYGITVEAGQAVLIVPKEASD